MNMLAIMVIGIAIWMILEILAHHSKSARAVRRRQFIATEVVCALIVMNTDGTTPKIVVAVIMQCLAVAISLYAGYSFIANQIGKNDDDSSKDHGEGRDSECEYVEVFALVPFGRERAVSKGTIIDAYSMMEKILIVLFFAMILVREILIFPDYTGHMWSFSGLIAMLAVEYASVECDICWSIGAACASLMVFAIICFVCFCAYDIMDTGGFSESDYQTETARKALLPLNQCFYELPTDLPDLSFGVSTKRDKLEDDVYLLSWSVRSQGEEKLKYCYSTSNNECAQERSGSSAEVYYDDNTIPRVVEVTKYAYGRYSKKRYDVETKYYIYIPQKNVKSLQ